MRAALLLAGLAVFVPSAVVASGPAAAQEQGRHDVTVTARDHGFSPVRLDGAVGDILRLTLVAEDQAYSFAIDSYRISKRFAPGHPVTFEFRLDRAGRFRYYCDLTTDQACAGMRGELVVTAQR